MSKWLVDTDGSDVRDFAQIERRAGVIQAMDAAQLFAQVVLAFLGASYLVFLGVCMIRYASRGSAGAHVLGAGLILMGFGNMQDPTMEMVQQAKQVKKHEEDDSGDPPRTED